MKAVQLLVNSYLPEDLRNYSQSYDKKSMNKILRAVADKYPDKFAGIQQKISDIGRMASYYQGETISLKDLASPIDKASILKAMDQEVAALPKDKHHLERKLEIFQKYNNLIEAETSKAALQQRNSIAMSALSGARGNAAQMKAMISTPGTYSDYKGRTVPVFSRESFAEGIRPATYLASTNGSRASVVSTKNSTARGGDWSKQAAAACTDLVIRENDCGTDNGILLAPDDKSLKGRVLAKSVAGVQAGTFITRDVLDKIQKSKVKGVMVRSAMTCGCGNGLCAKCIGKFYNGGKLPKIGDSIGLLASSTLGEPVVQGALNAKHTAGMTKNKRSYAGLDFITQFSQSPEVFKDRAAVTEEDGRVDRIEEAPQGGKYIFVNGKKYYTPIGLDPIVKAGDKVEAGDQLADGLVDPEDVVRLKGLGEGRRYYAERFGQILADSGAGTDKRNTEVLARGALRHVKVTSQDGVGCYLPDDTIDYNSFQKSYRVPETAREMTAKAAVGKYLQAPAMHYTIGTRITPKVAASLTENGYDKVLADDAEPGFQPTMVRLRTASHSNPDWLASMGTSYLTKQLNESATRGDDTNVLSNDDFRPRLAYGAGFGEHVRETGKF